MSPTQITYDGPANTGKTSARTDTFPGRFVKLVPGERVQWVVEFETADPLAALVESGAV